MGGYRDKDVNIQIGKKYGRLLILSYAGINKFKNRMYNCICDCGKEITVRLTSMKSGHSTSCGCYIAECTKERFIKPEGEASFNALYGSYRKSAKNRNHEFTLSKDEFREITLQDCFYCGVAPSQFRNHSYVNGFYIHNGIDRVDNNIGYDKENCVACCEWCNRMKLNYSLSEFEEQIEKVYLNLKLKESYV